MILKIYQYFMKVSPMFIDGFIYVCIQILTVLSTQIGTDEAAKYITPTLLFWIKILVGELAAGFLAVKMYRSTQYADHQKQETKEIK